MVDGNSKILSFQNQLGTFQDIPKTKKKWSENKIFLCCLVSNIKKGGNP